MKYVSHPLIYEDAVEDREYQRTISEAARNRNTLVVLPTALGKTVISALVAVDVLHSHRDKRVLVMAPTRPLCMQHMDTFRRVMRLPEDDFVLLTGRTQAAFREAVWSGGSRMVFATPQVVRNDLLAKRMTLKGFGLVVFDECHRSVKEYAYTEVASQYAKTSEYPLILGMTASPGSDIERVRNVCESLFIEHVEYRNDEDPDVKPYVQPITVETKTVDLPPAYQPLRDALKGMLDERVRWLQSRGHLKGAFAGVSRRQLIELGAELRYAAELRIEEERGPVYAVISRQASALTIFHMTELLETQGASTLRAFIERMVEETEGRKRSHSALMSDAAFTGLHDSLMKGEHPVEHPKVDTLRTLLADQFTGGSDSRALVFTQYRDTATHLVQELNGVPGVRAERFVGQASKLHDKGLSQDEQARVLRDLRKGYLNTLVATSIAEEGLDIPQVDLVVFYEPIPSEIRYIQRRGRTGRKTAGRVVILAAQDTYDMIYLYASQNRVERMKGITQKLNSVLKPVLRLRPMPAPSPLSPEDLAGIYARTSPRPEPAIVAASGAQQAEKEKLSEMHRQVSRAEKALYMKVLEKGTMGVDNELLYSEMEEEYGYPREVVKVALDRLAKEKHVVVAAPRSAHGASSSPASSSVPLKEIPGTRRMSIEVEKIASGHAVVWVDGKWRARLLPENYAGPRELIKKGRSFDALCSLYDDGGTLCVNVRRVVQARP
ncbi:MAG: DEAD/DEAH box helicase family protein [Nitrososphaerota archaeon]|nr:DEAD/DEAH box helicase family protein [Nitrososphaerota archaeon]